MQSSLGPSSSRLPTIVTALAIVLALIGVGGIAAGAADKPDDDATVASSGTTDTTARDSSGTTVAGGESPGTSAAGQPGATTKSTAAGGGSTPTTVSAACPSPPAASADPGGHQAPALGTYTYVSCADDSDTTDVKVAAGESSGGVQRRNISDQSSGFPQTSTFAYGPAGVIFESLTVTTPQGRFTCDWDPDVVNYPPTLKMGTEWTSKSSCDLKDARGVKLGTIDVDGSGKVTGRVAVSVGGTTVNAWAIEGTIVLTTETGFGNSTQTIKQRSYYDPTRGLSLFRHTEATSAQGNFTRDDRLVSLTPKS